MPRKTPPPRERRRPPLANPSRAERVPAVRRHPLYGPIPLVETVWKQSDGSSVTTWEYDLSYRPALPPGAVRGDIQRQHYCPMCHLPRYFYVDQERTCVDCGERFVFGAKEQKHWYETLQFHFDSVAIRCLACRRRRRGRQALIDAVTAAKSQRAEKPDAPRRWLAVAEALVRLHEHVGVGDLAEAIAAARSATKLDGGRTRGLAAEAHFWEGRAHALSGRSGRARACLEAAVADLPTSERCQRLRAEATWCLGELASSKALGAPDRRGEVAD